MVYITITGHAVLSHASIAFPWYIRIVWGILSHWGLDYAFKEYRPRGLHATNLKTWVQHLPWMLWQAAGTAAFIAITGDWLGLVYGMLPDIADGVWIAYNKLREVDVWMSGNLIGHPWSATLTPMTQLQNTVAEVALLAVLYTV